MPAGSQPDQKHSSQRYLQTVIPTGAGRRFFPSLVHERVGLRSGGISLRSLAQAKPLQNADKNSIHGREFILCPPPSRPKPCSQHPEFRSQTPPHLPKKTSSPDLRPHSAPPWAAFPQFAAHKSPVATPRGQ